MTSSALIDLILSYTDNISATDADNSTRRLRILQAAQEIFDEVWQFREWKFRLTTGNVTVTTGNSSVVVPSDFLELGSSGAVYSPDHKRMVERAPQELLEWRELGIGTGSPVDSFAFFDYDVTTGRIMFQILNAVTSNQIYKFWYNRFSPTLGDSTTPSVSNLHFVPAQYHNTVLVPGVAAKIRKQKGDTRDWEGQYQRGLTEMVLRERQHKSSVQQLPRATVGSW